MTSGRRPRRWRRSEFSFCCWGRALYLCRPILLPVVAALVIGTTLAPVVKAAARHRISPWATRRRARCGSGRRRRHRGDPARRTRQRLDRQGAGDRRDHQAEALRARLAVGGAARAARGPAAVGGERRGGRTVALGHGHAGARIRHAGGGSAHALLRDADLLSRQCRWIFADTWCRSSRPATASAASSASPTTSRTISRPMLRS